MSTSGSEISETIPLWLREMDGDREREAGNMKFIKVTSVDKNPAYINLSLVTTMVRAADNTGTRVYFLEQQDCIRILETPETILAGAGINELVPQ